MLIKEWMYVCQRIIFTSRTVSGAFSTWFLFVDLTLKGKNIRYHTRALVFSASAV